MGGGWWLGVGLGSGVWSWGLVAACWLQVLEAGSSSGPRGWLLVVVAGTCGCLLVLEAGPSGWSQGWPILLPPG